MNIKCREGEGQEKARYMTDRGREIIEGEIHKYIQEERREKERCTDTHMLSDEISN